MHGKEIGMSRGKRYSTEQIIGFLREAEVLLSQGKKLGDVCRKLGISEQSYYLWRKTYGGLKMDQARQFKELERENARLRKAVSELTLDKMILNEALSGKSFAPHVVKTVSSMFSRHLVSRSVVLAVSSVSTARPSVIKSGGVTMTQI